MNHTTSTIEYPPLVPTSFLDDVEKSIVPTSTTTTLRSVNVMRITGCILLVAVLFVYSFLVIYATKRRQRLDEKDLATSSTDSFPEEIRIRKVNTEISIEVVALAQSVQQQPSASRWLPSFMVKRKESAVIPLKSATMSTISPTNSSGTLTKNTLILDSSWASSSSSISPPSSSHPLETVISDVESVPSDEGRDEDTPYKAKIPLPQQYHVQPPPSRRSRSTRAPTPRKRATLLLSPSPKSRTPRHTPTRTPLQKSFITPSTTPSRILQSPHVVEEDAPSDEEDEQHGLARTTTTRCIWVDPSDGRTTQTEQMCTIFSVSDGDDPPV